MPQALVVVKSVVFANDFSARFKPFQRRDDAMQGDGDAKEIANFERSFRLAVRLSVLKKLQQNCKVDLSLTNH